MGGGGVMEGQPADSLWSDWRIWGRCGAVQEWAPVPPSPDGLSQPATRGGTFLTGVPTTSPARSPKRVNPYWVLRLVSRMNRWSDKTWASISS